MKKYILFIILILSQNIFAGNPPRFISTGNYVCPLDAKGKIGTCIKNGVDYQQIYLVGFIFNKDSTFAYLPTSDNFFHQCKINQSTGILDSCWRTKMLFPLDYQHLSQLEHIALSKSNDIVYIGSGGWYEPPSKLQILACKIQNNTFQGTCIDTQSNLDKLVQDNAVTSVALNQNNSIAYISTSTNYPSYNGHVTVCNVTDSQFSHCIVKSGGGDINFSFPGATALDEVNHLIYITDKHHITACSSEFNNTPRFDKCFTAYDFGELEWPTDISINNDLSLAYVLTAHGDDPVFYYLHTCAIRPDNTLYCDTLSDSKQFEYAGIVALGS